ncbi:dTDP-4-amino-4,6-dideoxyglucose formyltransferase [Halomonas daqiaonensis]|uniref:Formyl transferase n=1 Tax=Halomonas daqiaonensis TaxID=650850 RepID=A0A1H7GRK3_9GAMM|nr:dTDP-4-amino-4,6-dideoxyglucose formyltransferase [Halomonas daqiaonensis]SEK39632.1 Formyl transferase [Halomonas daqiaonensis]
MKVFFLTDNKIWFDFLEAWKKKRRENILIYCSPAGAQIFSEEIDSSRISILDVKNSFDEVKVEFDIGFSCHCKQIFPKSLVEIIPCFNFHPGLNPYNRGWFPQVFSIINGMPVGATLHKMDSKIDHGPVIAQRAISINSWDTSKSVYERVLDAEFELFDIWIERLLTGDFEEIELNDEGNYNSISDFNDLCEIDLDRKVSLREAIDFFRAMSFEGYDNAYFYDEDGRKVFVSLSLKVVQ